jgi:hypothetical protein
LTTPEPISAPRHRFDDVGVFTQFLSQGLNDRIHDVAADVVLMSPHILDQRSAIYRLALPLMEIVYDGKFQSGQCCPPIINDKLARVSVQKVVARYAKLAATRRASRPSTEDGPKSSMAV